MSNSWEKDGMAAGYWY